MHSWSIFHAWSEPVHRKCSCLFHRDLCLLLAKRKIGFPKQRQSTFFSEVFIFLFRGIFCQLGCALDSAALDPIGSLAGAANCYGRLRRYSLYFKPIVCFHVASPVVCLVWAVPEFADLLQAVDIKSFLVKTFLGFEFSIFSSIYPVRELFSGYCC